MTEAWLTGPMDGVDALLMPAAHSFKQVGQELPRLLDGLTVSQLWMRPGGSASIGFHAVHLAGATDRLLTYARGEQLSPTQAADIRRESTVDGLDAAQLLRVVKTVVDAALAQIARTSRGELTDVREVGRGRLPSTVIGLIFHAAEHATRHVGQISTLKRIVTS